MCIRDSNTVITTTTKLTIDTFYATGAAPTGYTINTTITTFASFTVRSIQSELAKLSICTTSATAAKIPTFFPGQ